MPGLATTRPLALAVLAGLLYCGAQPPVAVGALAFVALVPLLSAARDAGPGRGLVLGWITGTIACNGLTSASIFTALRRAHHPAWLAGAEAFAVPQLAGAIYFTAFGAYVALLERRRPTSPGRLFAVPAAWVACEVVRSRLGHGMPWVLLAHSQVDRLWLLQVADLGGAAAVSFVIALANVVVAASLEGRLRYAPWRRATAAAIGVVAATLAYGAIQSARWSAPRGASLDVALVQAAIPDAWRTTLARLPDTLDRYRHLVTEAVATHPELVVLPENAAGVAVTANPEVVANVTGALAGGDTMLLLGAPRAVALTPERATIRNSAFLLDAGGRVRGVYDKLHLVPFGETSTWLLPPALAARLGLADDYSAGDAPALLETGGVPFGVLICWEGIHADAARTLVRRGARFLVNLSNDDWFGGRAATEQHFRATLLRAVETRRFLLRATNSGVTAIVDPAGRVVATAARGVPAVTRGRVTAERAPTPYARVGDAFGAACALLAVTFLRRPRRVPAGDGPA